MYSRRGQFGGWFYSDQSHLLTLDNIDSDLSDGPHRLLQGLHFLQVLKVGLLLFPFLLQAHKWVGQQY